MAQPLPISKTIIQKRSTDIPEGPLTLTADLQMTYDPAQPVVSIGPMFQNVLGQVFEFDTKSFKSPLQMSQIRSIEFSISGLFKVQFVVYIPDTNRYFLFNFVATTVNQVINFGVNIASTANNFFIAVLDNGSGAVLSNFSVSISANNFDINTYTYSS